MPAVGWYRNSEVVELAPFFEALLSQQQSSWDLNQARNQTSEIKETCVNWLVSNIDIWAHGWIIGVS